MSNLKTYKFLALLALVLELILSFVFFGKIRNLFVNIEINQNASSFYFLIIASLIIFITLFVIAILLTNKNDFKDYNKANIVLEESSNTETKEIEEIKNESFNIENSIKKILPKDPDKLDKIQYTEKFLGNIAKEFDIVQGLFFVKDKESDIFNIIGKYAYFGEKEPQSFKIGETLSGQVAKNKTILNLKDIPENYVTILSGLGSSSPNHLLIIPIIYNKETIGIMELASFKEFKRNMNNLFEGISEEVGKTLSKY